MCQEVCGGHVCSLLVIEGVTVSEYSLREESFNHRDFTGRNAHSQVITGVYPPEV